MGTAASIWCNLFTPVTDTATAGQNTSLVVGTFTDQLWCQHRQQAIMPLWIGEMIANPVTATSLRTGRWCVHGFPRLTPSVVQAHIRQPLSLLLLMGSSATLTNNVNVAPATPQLTGTVVSSSEVDLNITLSDGRFGIGAEEAAQGSLNFETVGLTPGSSGQTVTMQFTDLTAGSTYSFRLRSEFDGMVAYSPTFDGEHTIH